MNTDEILVAEARGRLAGLREAAAALCSRCANGDKMTEYSNNHSNNDGGGGWGPSHSVCFAAKINVIIRDLISNEED